MTTQLRTPAQTDDPGITIRPAPRSIAAGVVLAGLCAAGLWSVARLGIDLGTLAESTGNATRFVQSTIPLDFPDPGELASLTLETLAIVFLATGLGVVLSVPVALAAAQATTRGRLSRTTARVLIVLARAVPDLILAIIFLRLFGLGPAAGILAMGIHSVGMIGKLYADAIEELDDAPRTAVESGGGSRYQQITAAIPLALLPQMIATALHRFDINLRTSVLLGYVGVGGLGLAISDALRVLDYQRGMALAIVVLVLCIVVELISGSIRAVLMNGHQRSSSTWVDRMFSRRGTTPIDRESQISPPWSLGRVRRLTAVAILVVFTLGSIWQVDLSPSALLSGLAELPETLGLFLPPSSGGIGASLMGQLLVTVQIAVAATFLGAVLALPIGVLAAGNVVTRRVIHSGFRLVIVVIRGIPELILAVIFVLISGLGAVAGTLALALGAVGLLSKLVADSLEETDPAVQEAVWTHGATGPQVFFAATLRQAAPAFVAHVMYLLDSNIRAATLLGVVGAGGIGFQLLNAARVNQFEVVTYILIMLLITVLAVEALAMWLRRVVR